MSERILAPLIVFLVLTGSTVAFGIELFGTPRPGRTAPALAEVRLNKVEITGRRPAVAIEVAGEAAGTGCGSDSRPGPATHI